MPTWTLPTANQGSWESVGIPGGLDQYLAGGVNDRAVTGTVIDVTASPYNADPTGVANCRDAIVAAVAAATTDTVIYFPAGTYRFSTGYIYLGYKTDVTIRGAGPGLTTFVCDAVNVPIFIWNAPGDYNTGVLEVTGTKTKDTSTLSVSDSTGYTEGSFALVRYENEVDNARIIAGAAPVWSSGGFAFSRKVTAVVTAVGTGTISIAPALPGDATNLYLEIRRRSSSSKALRIGVEDLTMQFTEGSHPLQGFYVQAAQYNWFYNVHFTNWTKKDANGSPIRMFESLGCEIRKCVFEAEVGSGGGTVSSDGAIETGSNSNTVIADNIFTGPFGNAIYDSGNAVNNVIAYNYCGTGSQLLILHNTHPSLNLVEGNYGTSHQSDGYHGSSSHNTIFRNVLTNASSIILNRFKRNYVVAGNTLGVDGVRRGSISFGNPNMGNGDASGFAGPTGLSDQAGEVDYMQNGVLSYTIQESDISVGDFWLDWEITGTLTTRTSDTVGVFTVNSGNWFTGYSPSGANVLLPTVHWNDKASRMNAGTVTNVSGSLVTISWSSGTLPAEGTAVQMYMSSAGWQERDLDVKASSLLVRNYYSTATGTGAIADDTADTLPTSLYLTSAPSWFGVLTIPAYDPSTPLANLATNIPAGWRAIYGNENYLIGVSAPNFSPEEGTYDAIQNVTITCSTPDTTIHYTTNGDTPTTGSSTYSTPVPITSTTTLKAIASDGVDVSSVSTGTYTLQAAVPVLSVAAGTYSSAQIVSFTCATSGVTFRYTTDGSTPTSSVGTVGTSATISETSTLRVVAYKTGLETSTVVVAAYTITPPASPSGSIVLSGAFNVGTLRFP
jgi:hypothetical protein